MPNKAKISEAKACRLPVNTPTFDRNRKSSTKLHFEINPLSLKESCDTLNDLNK